MNCGGGLGRLSRGRYCNAKQRKLWGKAGRVYFDKERMMKRFALGAMRFLKDEEGVTAIEYALIAALIAVVIIGGATAVGTNVNNLFLKVAGALANA